MKKFEEPKLNVEILTLEDVITTSSNDECEVFVPCDWDTGGM